MSDKRTRADLRRANGRLCVENGELRERLIAAKRLADIARVTVRQLGNADGLLEPLVKALREFDGVKT